MRIDLAGLPVVAEFFGQVDVLAGWSVGLEVAVGRIATAVFTREEGVSQRTEDGFGILPADGVKRAPGIGDVNCFVADGAKIAAAVVGENIEQFVCAGGSRQTSN